MGNPLDDMPTLASRGTPAPERERALTTDNARLRALIKAAEWATEDYCPWCNRQKSDGEHTYDCPAFTPEGEVR